VLLFLVQRRGTAAVGRFFGPVMIACFIAIAACGIGGIVENPDILAALSPTYATADAAEYLGLPRERTVIMGSRIAV
jgi:KUP system potassium uptake protein